MATQNAFKCPNGHRFSAVAKLRARCPECGLMTKRSFESGSGKTTVVSRNSSTSQNPMRKPVVQQKTLIRGSKPVSTLKKDVQLESETKSSPKPVVSIEKKPIVVRQGQVRKVAPRPVKQTAIPKPNNSPVVRRKAVVGSSPTVKRKPTGSKERKVVRQLAGDDQPYWVKVKRKFFR